MRFCLLPAAGVLIAALQASPHQNSPTDQPVVTISPPCLAWKTLSRPGQSIPATITIRYNVTGPHAPLASAKAVSVVIAEARFGSQYPTTILPMARASDGAWQAEFTPPNNRLPLYAMFLFRDEKGKVDNNSGQYWDILFCDNSQASDVALEMRASSYEGRLLAPGFQRPRDLSRAIEILRTGLAAKPSAVTLYQAIWRLELEKENRTPAAYEQASKEIDAFLDAHGKEPFALEQTSSFVAAFQDKISHEVVQRFRNALVALPDEVESTGIQARVAQQAFTRGLAQFDYAAIVSSQQSPREKAEAYLAFAAKYPQTLQSTSAYSAAFLCEKDLNDVVGAEAVYQKAVEANSEEVWFSLELAQLYIDNKIKPERALELLDKAHKIYAESELPSSHHHYQRIPGQLESLRGQAHLLLKDLPAARADFEAAVKAAPDNPDFAYALGQVCEQLGDNKAALDAYLAAASAPYEANANPTEAYERLFVAMKLGTKQEAEEEVGKRVVQRTRAAAAEYTPIAMNRPAPQFAFTDLSGRRFDNASLKGKPTIITFWGIWCPPCIAEMPAIEKVQLQHPEASMLAVEIGNKPDEVKTFLAAHKLTALHVATQPEWPEGFGLTVAPTTVVLDRFGQIQFLHSGQLSDVEAILGKDLDALPDPIKPQTGRLRVLGIGREWLWAWSAYAGMR